MRINTGCWVDGCKCFDSEDEDGVEIKRDREWVGLTDEEIRDGNRESWVTTLAWQSACWWAEAKLKDKNT